MNSLWLSLTDSTDHPAIHKATREYLEGWLTPRRVSDALTMVTELVHHVEGTGRRSELILSRHDNTLLIEVVAQGFPPARAPADGNPSRTQPTRAHNWGTHPTTTGVVVWAEIPLDNPKQPRLPTPP
ncbi:hypothetical protein [Actinoplanes sp. DH11]|uniref:hypothetical protein n=1 Tax=Actinoplanes sp. DH11 TaxID=2857011 RepID=UPI001E46A8B0|nr:hypothetical protein [Actinoplanes sp. DH11]